VPDAQRQSSMRSKPKGSAVRNWAALSHWRRKRKMEERIDEVRFWLLTCDECEHVGSIEVTLRRLRSANLICSECGVPIRKRN